jgi:hypothetical protein
MSPPAHVFGKLSKPDSRFSAPGCSIQTAMWGLL